MDQRCVLEMICFWSLSTMKIYLLLINLTYIFTLFHGILFFFSTCFGKHMFSKNDCLNYHSNISNSSILHIYHCFMDYFFFIFFWKFKVLYSQSMDDFWATSVGLFIACVIFVFFLWFVRVGLFIRRNSRPGAEAPFDTGVLLFVSSFFF